MSDDVSQAASIGTAIDQKTGSIPLGGNKKKSDKKTDKTTDTTTTTTTTDTAVTPTEIKDPGTKKPSNLSKKVGRSATIKDVKSAMAKGKIDQEQAIYLSNGYARNYAKKEVGQQFKGYTNGLNDTSGQPPVDLTSNIK